jgi:hypothetical protein
MRTLEKDGRKVEQSVRDKQLKTIRPFKKQDPVAYAQRANIDSERVKSNSTVITPPQPAALSANQTTQQDVLCVRGEVAEHLGGGVGSEVAVAAEELVLGAAGGDLDRSPAGDLVLEVLVEDESPLLGAANLEERGGHGVGADGRDGQVGVNHDGAGRRGQTLLLRSA